jgi:hypothetical protein
MSWATSGISPSTAESVGVLIRGDGSNLTAKAGVIIPKTNEHGYFYG